jgi:hypothetical protein
MRPLRQRLYWAQRRARMFCGLPEVAAAKSECPRYSADMSGGMKSQRLQHWGLQPLDIEADES